MRSGTVKKIIILIIGITAKAMEQNNRCKRFDSQLVTLSTRSTKDFTTVQVNTKPVNLASRYDCSSYQGYYLLTKKSCLYGSSAHLHLVHLKIEELLDRKKSMLRSSIKFTVYFKLALCVVTLFLNKYTHKRLRRDSPVG